MSTQKAKILGDHDVADFLKDVRIDDLLGMHCSVAFVSSLSTLALEMDSKGPESIMILCCMSSITGPIFAGDTGCELQQVMDRLRVIFDGYLVGSHEIYLCPPLGLPSVKISKISQMLEQRYKVRLKFEERIMIQFSHLSVVSAICTQLFIVSSAPEATEGHRGHRSLV